MLLPHKFKKCNESRYQNPSLFDYAHNSEKEFTEQSLQFKEIILQFCRQI